MNSIIPIKEKESMMWERWKERDRESGGMSRRGKMVI